MEVLLCLQTHPRCGLPFGWQLPVAEDAAGFAVFVGFVVFVGSVDVVGFAAYGQSVLLVDFSYGLVFSPDSSPDFFRVEDYADRADFRWCCLDDCCRKNRRDRVRFVCRFLQLVTAAPALRGTGFVVLWIRWGVVDRPFVLILHRQAYCALPAWSRHAVWPCDPRSA